jgi:hypothetical protein
MKYRRGAAVAVLAASALLLPMSQASARCWNNGWGWHCGPGLLALPFVVAGTAVAGAAAIATAPVRALAGPPAYRYPPPGYYYPPPGYYYPQPPVDHSNN